MTTSFRQGTYPVFTGMAKIEYLKVGATNRGFVSLDPERQRELDDQPQPRIAARADARRTSQTPPTADRDAAGRSTGGFSRGNA